MDSLHVGSKPLGAATILIAGGFGFVGSHLASALVERGGRVTVLDLDVRPDRPSLVNLHKGLRDRVTLVQGDLSEMGPVRRLIEQRRFTHIINAASYASVIERAVNAPYETIRTNTLGLVNLLESVRLLPRDAWPTSIVHLSTDKVYGDSGGEPYDEEKSPLRAEGVYDVAKLASDSFARLYHTAYGLPTVVLRMCNIFGPGDFNTAHRVVPKSLDRIFRQPRPEPPEVYEASLGHGRDYLYVDDCVRAILSLATVPACIGQVFNLPGCAYRKTPEMVESVIEAAATVEERYDPARAAAIRANGYRVVPSSGSAAATIADQKSEGKKLTALTGFRPSVSLSDGLIRTATWTRELARTSSGHSQGDNETLEVET